MKINNGQIYVKPMSKITLLTLVWPLFDFYSIYAWPSFNLPLIYLILTIVWLLFVFRQPRFVVTSILLDTSQKVIITLCSDVCLRGVFFLLISRIFFEIYNGENINNAGQTKVKWWSNQDFCYFCLTIIWPSLDLRLIFVWSFFTSIWSYFGC